MLQVFRTSWALLLGMMLLMVGNGLQGTLLGVRGAIEGFSNFEISIVMSAYFAGFLGGSKIAPLLIRRVGHVRVFAALGSLISAALILFPVVVEPWAWTALRVILGFCFSGVYVTAESWLNNAASNENRGQALSLYVIVMMLGIIVAQGILVLGDPSGFILFIVPSVLVSIAFAPILLSISPTPAFTTTKSMSLAKLFDVSPLGFIGLFLLGSALSAQYGMAAVYGIQMGLSLGEVSAFVSSIYIGAVVMQFPIGWISDRMDRRLLVLVVALSASFASALGLMFGNSLVAILTVAFLVGGASNPLYSLLIAYTNDFLEADDMAAASGGLIFINGLGAIAGPIATGWIMAMIGPIGFWLFIGILMALIAVYAGYRMTQRASTPVDDATAYVGLSPSVSIVAVEAAQEWVQEVALAEEAETTDAK